MILQAILLRANKAHAVPLDGRNRKFAVSYHVEGNELGKRRYHVDQFEVSKRASKVRLHMSTTLLSMCIVCSSKKDWEIRCV